MNHYYQQASFLQSATTRKTMPEESGLEIAFAGRSNAGKSSVINRVCSQKALARTSKTPGRTQLINFFQLQDANFLVDLPGYGYAKVPEAVKLEWQKFIESYLTQRNTLQGNGVGDGYSPPDDRLRPSHVALGAEQDAAGACAAEQVR